MTQTEWLENFRNRLNEAMNTRGFSQNQLARKSGLSASRINSYIKDGALPTVYAIINMAYALDVTPSELVDFDERISKIRKE